MLTGGHDVPLKSVEAAVEVRHAVVLQLEQDNQVRRIDGVRLRGSPWHQQSDSRAAGPGVRANRARIYMPYCARRTTLRRLRNILSK